MLKNPYLSRKGLLTSPKTMPSRTSQEGLADSDINVIVARFLKAGQPFPTSPASGQVVDAARFPDLLGVLKSQRFAQDAFAALPRALRGELDNDYRNFLPWLQDPANRGRATKLGFFRPGAPVPVAPPAALPREAPPVAGSRSSLEGGDAAVAAKA